MKLANKLMLLCSEYCLDYPTTLHRPIMYLLYAAYDVIAALSLLTVIVALVLGPLVSIATFFFSRMKMYYQLDTVTTFTLILD